MKDTNGNPITEEDFMNGISHATSPSPIEYITGCACNECKDRFLKTGVIIK